MALPMKPIRDRPDLKELLRKSAEAVKNMTPVERRKMYEAQRRSWCVGETMLENPDMSREEAEALYERATHHC